ncbi:MAG: colanic acid biosynthesis glycosyltransferase WcaL [Ramlibacter sp.]|jgi:glycosyltransferase involved in cell wall biosynthesis|nr:colanic acid biosynthesis glycosyltransferase WcaL [Ramlibacter sp.]
MMRVAYLVNQYPKVSHSFIRREILALEAMGTSVLRVASRGWKDALVDRADEEERRKTHYLLQHAGPLLSASLRVFLDSPRRFVQAARCAIGMARMSPRPWPVHLAYLVQACLLRELAQREGVAHVHAHFGTNGTEVAMLCARLGGPPFSFTVHGPEEFDMPAGLHLGEKVQAASFVAAISSFGRSQLYRWIPHAHWPKVKVVRCGVDEAFTQAVHDVPPASRMVVCVGRLCEQKGQMLLLSAAREMARRGEDFELVLAGDGEMRAELERLIDAYQLRDRVRITGWVSGQQVRELLLQARALILPSFAEGLPVVIMEAMALGRPVITTSIAGIPELVRDGQEGWLVPAGDCAALVQAWTDLMRAEPSRLEAMGSSARERVTRRHSAAGGARKLMQFFGGAA